MKTPLAVCIYLVGLVVANILVGHLGPSITPVVGFLFIGLDLSLRDWLHLRIRPWQMGALIFAAGIITFAVAALCDWFVFSRARGSWLQRAIRSNVAGDAVDSILFPCLAFGVFLPVVIAGQFLAKFAGSTLWALLLNWTQTKVEPA